MTASVIAFYIISAFILTGGLLAVTSRKIFRSAVWLLISLTGIAALYFWMDLQFLAAVQIIVYIGGIVVLIIFSIFLTAHTGADLPRALFWRKWLSAFLAFAGFIIVCCMIFRDSFTISSEDFSSGICRCGVEAGHARGFSTGLERRVRPAHNRGGSDERATLAVATGEAA